MVHSALKRKRYIGDPADITSTLGSSTTLTPSVTTSLTLKTPINPTTFSTQAFYQRPTSPPHPLLTPPLPTATAVQPAPSAPDHDPRPSLQILLDLMTPGEFAKLLRARVKRLLAKWPPHSPQSHVTHALPSPTASSSSSSSQFKSTDTHEPRDPGPAAIKAFVAFFRLEDVRTPFSFTLPELHTNLLALQTLLSFLSSRELKEIVKARLTAEGDELERWTVVQGVLDVMRNASGEEDENDVEIGASGAILGGEMGQSDESKHHRDATKARNSQSMSHFSSSSPQHDPKIETARDAEAYAERDVVGLIFEKTKKFYVNATESDEYGSKNAEGLVSTLPESPPPPPRTLRQKDDIMDVTAALHSSEREAHLAEVKRGISSMRALEKHASLASVRKELLENTESTGDSKESLGLVTTRPPAANDAACGQIVSKNASPTLVCNNELGLSHTGPLSSATSGVVSMPIQVNNTSVVESKRVSPPPKPVQHQDVDTDVDMEMSDEEQSGDSRKAETRDVARRDAIKSSSPRAMISSSSGLVNLPQVSAKVSEKSGLNQSMESRVTSSSRANMYHLSPSPVDAEKILHVPSMSQNVVQESSTGPTVKRRRIDHAKNYPLSPTMLVAGASSSELSLVSTSAPAPVAKPQTAPRSSTLGFKPAPTFVPARLVSSYVTPNVLAASSASISASATIDLHTSSQERQSASQIKRESSLHALTNSPPQTSNSNPTLRPMPREAIASFKEEFGANIVAEREEKMRLRNQQNFGSKGSNTSPILFSDVRSASPESFAMKRRGHTSVCSFPRNGSGGACFCLPGPVSPRRSIPSVPSAINSVVPAKRSIFVPPTDSPVVQESVSSPSQMLRPEGPELPPPFEIKPPSVAVRSLSKGKSPKVNASANRSSTTVGRGRGRSRSESTRSGGSDSRSRSSSRHDSHGRHRRVACHRLPRRIASRSPSHIPRISGSYSSSRSRSRPRSPSSSRVRSYRSRRSPSRSPSRSISPAFRRRRYSYSRPPSPSMRRESPMRYEHNVRHWSPDEKRLVRGRRSITSSLSPTPPRALPSRDHWSPGMDGTSRRASGVHRTHKANKSTEAKGHDKPLVGADVLAQPMKYRENSATNAIKGLLRRK